MPDELATHYIRIYLELQLHLQTLANAQLSLGPLPPITVSTLQMSSNHSTSSATTTMPSERHSLNHGPRPLHLVHSNNVTSNLDLTSSVPATAPLIHTTPSSQSSFYASPSPSPGPTPFSPTSSLLFSPPVSPPAVGGTGPRKTSRRQSSISYFSSNHDREFPPTTPLRNGHAHAPSGSSLTRSTSLGVKSGATVSGVLKVEARRASTDLVDSPTPGDRGPLTLTEKHADLLHFIAQKESKCLELRSSLAKEEDELLQLKKKWERIVNRGFQRSHGVLNHSVSISGNKSNSNNGGGGMGFSKVPSASSGNGVGGSGSGKGGGAGLEGFKESVQGVGRFLVAGLGELSATHSSSPALHHSHLPSPLSSHSPTPTPSTPPSRQVRRGHHSSSQSHSSVSTAYTTTASTTSSSNPSRLSQGSLTSGGEEDTVSLVPEEEEEECSNLMMGPTTEEPMGVVTSTGTRRSLDAVGEEMPTSNPNAKIHRRKSREVQPLPPSPSSPPSTSDNNQMYTDSPTIKASSSSAAAKRLSGSMGAGLPPASSIPGLGPLGSVLVGSVGKKWEELQKGPTFTKNQKRASVLFSDVSQSIFAAFASPGHIHPPSSSSPLTNSPDPRSSLSLSSATPSPLTTHAKGTFMSSLLDDDDTFDGGLGSVLMPDTMKPLVPTARPVQVKAKQDDDDDWNW
ncbi:hypothetical protein JAAARDRAFT_205256 [Jaapia argillacea MUCL 33604]|uniref:Uncharacterized protein n=1 Tax=Jaapia argillacea MUCL 33604 TaxID=933084 RepID=A0A067PZM7_9AGAM|nr:hypothetical protein JAAARDRAFT_205256 [Jaapia argillacea MUCL 33604]